MPVAARSCRVPCSHHGWGKGTVLGTRGQRVPGPRARGEAEPRAPGAGCGTKLGRWQEGRGSLVPATAPGSPLQPLPRVPNPKSQLKPKRRIPARLGRGSHSCLASAPSLPEPPELPLQHLLLLLRGLLGSPPCPRGASLHPNGSEAGDKMPLCSQVPGTVMGCPHLGGLLRCHRTPRPREGGVVPVSPLPPGDRSPDPVRG